MDIEERNYNIEDTGALMLEQRARVRRKGLILLVVAIVAVAVIAAVVGIKVVGDKRYDDQVAIAEKALKEGNYEQAETEYLAAVKMNKRKVKAREGLAYTYAVEEKFEESTDLYQGLYDETKNEIYKVAADETASGMIPSVDEVVPVENLWLEVPVDRMPDPEDFRQFMSAYLDHYSYYSYVNAQKTGDSYGDWYFDKEKPEQGYSFLIAERLLYENGYFEYKGTRNNDYESNGDPRGWYELGYIQVEKASADRAWTELFNTSEEAIESVVKSAEKRQLMYQEGDYYYIIVWPMGIDPITASPLETWKNGSEYCIKYRASQSYLGHPEESTDIGDFYAVMRRKDVNGHQRWTMIYNGKEMPDYVEDSLKKKEEPDNTVTENKDTVFSELKDVTFVFSSGAGAWGTELTINANGSFNGAYHDSDMGDTGQGYPNGTLYRCNFKGRFSTPEKVDDYTYRFKVGNIEFDEEPDKEYIEDGTLIKTTEAYGIGKADTVELYLPGKPASELSEDFLNWMLGVAQEEQYKPVMKIYGLCVNGSTGFAGQNN